MHERLSFDNRSLTEDQGFLDFNWLVSAGVQREVSKAEVANLARKSVDKGRLDPWFPLVIAHTIKPRAYKLYLSRHPDSLLTESEFYLSKLSQFVVELAHARHGGEVAATVHSLVDGPLSSWIRAPLDDILAMVEAIDWPGYLNRLCAEPSPAWIQSSDDLPIPVRGVEATGRGSRQPMTTQPVPDSLPTLIEAVHGLRINGEAITYKRIAEAARCSDSTLDNARFRPGGLRPKMRQSIEKACQDLKEASDR